MQIGAGERQGTQGQRAVAQLVIAVAAQGQGRVERQPRRRRKHGLAQRYGQVRVGQGGSGGQFQDAGKIRKTAGWEGIFQYFFRLNKS